MTQICFGLALALGMSGAHAGAATLLVFGGPVGGGCSNAICYSGPPTTGTLATNSGENFMNYSAGVDARGLYAAFTIYGFRGNSGSMTFRSTDVFTVAPIASGAAGPVDVTARLRVNGGFGIQDFDRAGATAGAMARAYFSVPSIVPGLTILDGSERDVTVRPQLLDPVSVLPPNVAVVFEPKLMLRVEAGLPFPLETTLALSLGFSNRSEDAVGGALFGESALISFDLPEGYFITSERGYSQGFPADADDLSVIPLPAGGWLLLSAVGLMGWAVRRRLFTLAR